MSGGHWDYKQFEAVGLLTEVARDAMLRWPKTARRIEALSAALGEILHEMDYDFSGDAKVRDDKTFDDQAVIRLKRAVN